MHTKEKVLEAFLEHIRDIVVGTSEVLEAGRTVAGLVLLGEFPELGYPDRVQGDRVEHERWWRYAG